MLLLPLLSLPLLLLLPPPLLLLGASIARAALAHLRSARVTHLRSEVSLKRSEGPLRTGRVGIGVDVRDELVRVLVE